MTDFESTAAIAWLIPLVASFLKGQRWPAAVKLGIVAVLSFGTATVAGIISGNLTPEGFQDGEAFFGSAAWAFAEAQIIYRLFFKGTDVGRAINDRLTKTNLRLTTDG